jgi:hypothetical protein
VTKQLRRAAHRSVRQLDTDIRAWIVTGNENPYPVRVDQDRRPDSRIHRHPLRADGVAVLVVTWALPAAGAAAAAAAMTTTIGFDDLAPGTTVSSRLDIMNRCCLSDC